MNNLNRIFANNLKYYMQKKNKNQKEVCTALKINTSSMSDYCNGKQYPRPDVIQKLADFFNIPVDYLITNQAQENNTSHQRYVKIPVLGYVKAGIPIEAIEDILGYEEIPETLAKTGEFFGLKIKGDSMYPILYDGDIVIVKRQTDIEHNSVGVILIDGHETTVKRIKKYDDAVALVAENPKYTSTFFTNNELDRLYIIGMVIESRRKFT